MCADEPRVMCLPRRLGKALSEHIRDIVCSSTLHKLHHAVSYEVPDEIASHVNVPGEIVIYRIFRNLNAGGIILPDLGGIQLFDSKSSQHCSEVHNLLSTHAGCDILSLRGAESDTVLVFCLP